MRDVVVWPILWAGLFGSAFTVFPLSSEAHDRTIADRLTRLEQENAALRELVNTLSDQQKQLLARLDSASSDVTSLAPASGSSSASSADTISLEVHGALQADAAFFSDDIADYPDGTDFRRARLEARGSFLDHWDYRLEADFAFDDARLINTYLRYRPSDTLAITVGQHKPPLSMDFLHNLRHRTFVEHAAASDVLAPKHKVGVGVAHAVGNWSVALGAFGESTASQLGDDEGSLFSVRTTYAPVYDGHTSLHLGIGAHYRLVDASDTVRFRARPETRLSNSVFALDTGNITDVDHISTIGTELAGSYGPAFFQSEYLRSDVARSAGYSDADFSGWYVQGSWFLTGENRPYSTKKGLYGAVTPKQSLNKGGIGAWEIAARYGSLDLTDNGILAGTMRNTTLGLNWYPNSYVRFMGNYILVDTDQHAVTAHDAPHVFVFRTQVSF